MVLPVSPLVTPVAARTAKLAKFEPSIGVASAGAATQNAATRVMASLGNDLSPLAMRLPLACLDAIFMVVSSLGEPENDQVRRTIVLAVPQPHALFVPNIYFPY